MNTYIYIYRHIYETGDSRPKQNAKQCKHGSVFRVPAAVNPLSVFAARSSVDKKSRDYDGQGTQPDARTAPYNQVGKRRTPDEDSSGGDKKY